MKYRKVSPVIWQDEKFRAFTDDGKLAFLFLLTHPALTLVGAMRGTLAGLAAELGWPPRRLDRALAPAIKAGMVEINLAVPFIGLPKFLRHNPPDNPNVVKSWVRVTVEHLPECPERDALITRCRAALTGAFLDAFDHALQEAFPQGLPEPFTQPFTQPLGQPVANGMPIQEQLAVSSKEPPKPPEGASDGPVLWLLVLNREARSHFKPTDSNLRPIRARLREGHTLAEAETVVRYRVAAWAGTDNAQYLRPMTVFGPKFDSYLQAARNGDGGSQEDDLEG